MRPATVYYLAQLWSPPTSRPGRRNGAPPRPASRPGHARLPRRGAPARGLLTLTRRVFAMLNGTSQAA